MKVNHHSLTISIKRKPSCYLLSFKAIGKLTIEDYKIISPIIASTLSLEQYPKLDILIDVSQFQGWTLRAAWNDFILSVTHCAEFQRVAVFGSRNWQRVLSQAGNWLIKGDVRFFNNRMEATNWIEKQ
jgi:hypothetical protein